MRRESLKKSALTRIKELFNQAKENFNSNPGLSNKYVKLARKTAMKVNLRIPSDYKRQYCKHCYSYLKPGVNLRVRNNKSRITYYCLNCKNYTRFLIKKKKRTG